MEAGQGAAERQSGTHLAKQQRLSFLPREAGWTAILQCLCVPVGTLHHPVAWSRPGLGSGQMGRQEFPPAADAKFEHTNVFQRLVGWDGEQCAGYMEGCWSWGPILLLWLPHQEPGATLGPTGNREEKGSAETVVSRTS